MNILFTFETDTAKDQFLNAIKRINLPDKKLILSAIDTAQFDVIIKECHECALWVSGEKLIEGSRSIMQERFMQECDSHSASVVLKEYKNSEWHVIRTRRLQPS